MRKVDVLTVFRKEMTDLLRDRRSVIATIVLPMLLFPILLFGSKRLEELRAGRLDEETVVVSLSGSQRGVETLIEADPFLERRDVADPEKALRRDEIQAALLLPGALPSPGGAAVVVTLYYDESDELSRLARERLNGHLETWRESLQAERLAAIEAPADVRDVLDLEMTNIASEARMAGGRLGKVFPMMLVFLLLNGAAYAAVDLFSGEKERKTLETLLTSLADRRSVVLGKFLTVFVVAETSTVLFVLSNLVSTKLGLTGAEAGRTTLALSPGVALIVFVVTLPLGILMSAILSYLSSCARTYREAQTLILPFTFGAILPAALGTLPGIRIDSVVAVVPVANVSVAVREALIGHFPPLPLAVVIVSNLAYAAWVLSRAARLFDGEAVILGSSSAIPTLFRRERPLVREAMIFYSAELLALYYIGSSLQAKNLMVGLFITLYGMLLVPSLLFARYHRLPLRAAFSLRRAPALTLVAALLMAPGTLLVANGLFRLQSRFVPVPEELFSSMEGLLGSSDRSVLLTFFLVALSPAICEEILFRGLLLGRLRRAMAPWRAALAGGLLFGLFHLSIYRILPTAFMGITAGALVLLSGSIFPAMVLHGTYNGMVIFGEHFDVLRRLDGHDPSLIAIAALLGIGGIVLLLHGRRAGNSVPTP